MEREREYWHNVLADHLPIKQSGLRVVPSTLSVSVREKMGNSPTPTFYPGTTFHTEDPTVLLVDGNGIRRMPALKVQWDRISSITFSYHGPDDRNYIL
jgi:hypothetical protein